MKGKKKKKIIITQTGGWLCIGGTLDETTSRCWWRL